MISDHDASTGALFDRADRAIAEAVAIRAEVRATLAVAGRRRMHRIHAGDTRPSEALPLDPMLPPRSLEPWWSIARALADAGEIMREADHELDRAWHRVLPTIRTPSTLFEG